jgi:DNA-binding transcriptional LysR family regulator
MDKAGFELSLLSKFVLACQSPRLADAAKEIGQTPAALSIALHGLEDKLGLKLFERRGGGLDLLPSAFWLFRNGSHLLYLEQHAREARIPQGQQLIKLHVDLDLHFAIGRVSRAVLLTAQQMIAAHPELLFEWRFAGLDDGDIGDPSGLAALEVLPERSGHLRIFYGTPADAARGALRLHEDHWIIVGSKGSRTDAIRPEEPLTLLRMRQEIVAEMTRFAAERGFAGRLLYRDEEPAQISALLRDHPQMRVLMPASLLPRRLGLTRHEETPFAPAFSSCIHGEATGTASQYGEVFFRMLRSNLASGHSAMFTPRLTTRQIQLFNLIAQTGSISAAARAANTAQPAVSRQINQMEKAAGTTLLLRTEEGATLSPPGRQIRPRTAALEERLDWILRKARDIAAHSQARVTIGTLPSSGHDSAMTERIARAMTRIHTRHPDWQLQIVENSNTVLHERVRSGDINLALVGMVHAQVARIQLGPAEPLCVIGNPSINPGGRKELTLEEAAALPLVLGRNHLSIHQSFASAARERSIKVKAVIEVGSLALAIAMVRQAPLCTILPASSVRRDIAAGNLIAVPIRQDDVPGALSIIFSAERELSEAERTIIQEFVREFRQGASLVVPELSQGLEIK